MIFGVFRSAKPSKSSLTEFCKLLSDPTALLNTANSLIADRSNTLDKRVEVLNLIVMGGAGNLVKDLDSGIGGDSSLRVLGDTNLDVITAEALVWVHFLIMGLWKNDPERNSEIFKRVNDSTFLVALKIALDAIESETGFDFREGAAERKNFYIDAIKDRTVSFEPFATIVYRSLGRQSLAEPLKSVDPLSFSQEWTVLSAQVAAFFSTMPLGCYESFKEGCRQLSAANL